MRKLITALFLIFSLQVSADCTKEQDDAEIKIKVVGSLLNQAPNDNHKAMNRIVIYAPLEVAGLPIKNMDLTRGEVAEFWFPIAYTNNETHAIAALNGYPNALKNLEIAIYYSNGSCTKSIQKLL